MAETGAFERVLSDEAATGRLGEDIALALGPGDLVALRGELGAGKTALARAIIRALSGDPDLEVPSPTFTLVQTYDARIPVQHFDLYRLSSPEELDELGLAEATAAGAALVEWPEKAASLPGTVTTVMLEEHGDGRIASIAPAETARNRFARSFAIRDFLDANGRGGASRTFLVGDASVRAYETVVADGERFVLMDAPERTVGPPVRDGLPYARIAHLAESVVPFVAVNQALRGIGVCAPEILAADLGHGLLLCEYLGSDAIATEDGRPVPERYLAAAELLARVHQTNWPGALPVPGAAHYQPPTYDHDAMAIETELLTEWYVPWLDGTPADCATREAFGALWEDLFARLDRAERTLVLRDYHSPNLVWRDDRSGSERIGVIDFQDALFGPAAYDVASLALDARATIPEDLEQELVEAYCASRGPGFDRASFDEAFAIAAAQRNSKLLGIFVRLDRRDGKPAYLRHLPRIRSYLRRVFRHPVLADLAAFYEKAGFLSEVAR